MFDVHLKPFERRGLIGLEFPWGVRAAALAGAALVAAASFAGGPPALAGLVLAAVFLLGSLYDEQWAFDAKQRHVYFRLGLIGLGRTRRWDFDAVEALELSAFRRGTLPGTRPAPGFRRGRPAFAVLSLRFRDGSSRVLERRPARRAGELEEAAQTLAAATGLAVSRDTSW